MVLLLVFLVLGSSASKLPPNIVFMLVDGLGWDDVSFHGSPQIPTPNMDALAADGIILNNYYVQPVCTQSRAALMTGMYPIHTGLQHGVLLAAEPNGLPLEFKIMPEYFKDLGYETHLIGKWNLGYYMKEYTPTYRGFDSFYGFYNYEEDYFTHNLEFEGHIGLDFWLNTEPVLGENGNYSTHLYTERAKFLIANRDVSKPFFLYLSHQSVHGASGNDPLQAPEENIAKFPYIGDERRTKYAGMVDALDESAGDVLEALYEAGMLANTIIVMSSANGGLSSGVESNAGSNFPLRGGKGALWEGGTRASAFIWSPLLYQKNRVSDQMMHITDWLPTLYAAAQGNPFNLGTLDGQNLWNHLSYNLPSPRYELLYNIDPIDQTSAIRFLNYKLVLGESSGSEENDHRLKTPGNSRPYRDLDIAMAQSKAARVLRNFHNRGILFMDSNWRQKAALNCGDDVWENFVPGAPPYLFDLAKDPCEMRNIVLIEPGWVSILTLRLHIYEQTSIAPSNKQIDPRGFPENLNGTWAPWIQ